MHFKTPFSIDRSSTPRPPPAVDITNPASNMPSIRECTSSSFLHDQAHRIDDEYAAVPSMSRSTNQTHTFVAPATPTRKVFRRRPSMLERWLVDQRDSDDELEHRYEPQTPVCARTPYIEHPDRGAGASTSSFVLVASEEDREIGQDVRFPIENTRFECMLNLIKRFPRMGRPVCPPVSFPCPWRRRRPPHRRGQGLIRRLNSPGRPCSRLSHLQSRPPRSRLTPTTVM